MVNAKFNKFNSRNFCVVKRPDGLNFLEFLQLTERMLVSKKPCPTIELYIVNNIDTRIGEWLIKTVPKFISGVCFFYSKHLTNFSDKYKVDMFKPCYH